MNKLKLEEINMYGLIGLTESLILMTIYSDKAMHLQGPLDNISVIIFGAGLLLSSLVFTGVLRQICVIVSGPLTIKSLQIYNLINDVDIGQLGS